MPTLSDYQLQIGSLVLGPGTPYIVHNVDGFGVPEIRTNDTAKPLEHGMFYGTDFLGGRQVKIDLTAAGVSASDAVALLDALQAVWTPIDSDTTTVSPLYVKLPGKVQLHLNGRPRRSTIDSTRIVGSKAPIKLEYFSGDPRWYSDTVTTNLYLAQTSVGRGYNRAYDYGYGGSSAGGPTTIANAGNFKAKPYAVINGPVTNPRIENVTTGALLDFNLTLASGEFLVVDFDQKTVRLNGTANRYYTIRSGGSFFDINPGGAAVRFGAGSYDPTAYCAFTSASAWV